MKSAADREPLETTVGDDIFTFRFNRVRERGRGWVMAGFEVSAARRRTLGPVASSAASTLVAGLSPERPVERPPTLRSHRAVLPEGTADYFGDR